MAQLAVVQLALSSSASGNTDFITTDLNGEIPVGCMIIANWAEADGVAIDNVVCAIGLCDDTNEGCVSGRIDHGVSISDAAREVRSTAVLDVPSDLFLGDVDATFVSFITNGIRLNITDNPVATKLYTFVFWSGTDVSAYMELATLGSASTTTSITGAGFQADAAILVHAGISEGTSGHMNFSFGMCTPGVADFSYSMYSADGLGNAACVSTVMNNRCLSYVSTTGGGTLRWAATSSINANGMDIDLTSDGGAFADCIVLLLKFDNQDVKVGAYTAPTSGGDDVTTGVGHKPGGVILALQKHTAYNSVQNSSIMSWGIGAFTPDAQVCNSWADEDASALMDNQSISDNGVALNVPDHQGTPMQVATLASMDSDGFTLNHTTNAIAALGFYMSLQEVEADIVVLRRRREENY